MSNIKILIVENETIAAEALASVLREAEYDIIGCCDNGPEAIRIATENPPDLIFMDIRIEGDEDGIETAKKLKLISNFPIIFLTNISDDETIQKAQAAKPANYLLKPFMDSQIYVSINNALYTASEQRRADIKDNNQEFPDEKLKILEGKFFAKNNSDTFHRYNIADILFIEASRSYCNIHMANGKKIVKTTSMKDIESKLQYPHFFKASRSYIVNLDKVEGLKGRMLVIGKHEIKLNEDSFEFIKQSLNMI